MTVMVVILPALSRSLTRSWQVVCVAQCVCDVLSCATVQRVSASLTRHSSVVYCCTAALASVGGVVF